MSLKIGINGSGNMMKALLLQKLQDNLLETQKYPKVKIVAVNDNSLSFNPAAGLRRKILFDGIRGLFSTPEKLLESQNPNSLSINGEDIMVFNKPHPHEIPWQLAQVEVVIEASGEFQLKREVQEHFAEDVAYVLVTNPMADKSEADAHLIYGVNHGSFDPQAHRIISQMNFITQATAFILKALEYRLKMSKLHIHAELPGAQPDNIFPTKSKGETETFLGELFPSLNGKITYTSAKVPSPIGFSLTLLIDLGKPTQLEKVKTTLKEASGEENPLTEVLRYRSTESLPTEGLENLGERWVIIPEDLLFLNERRTRLIIRALGDNETVYAHNVLKFINYIDKRRATYF